MPADTFQVPRGGTRILYKDAGEGHIIPMLLIMLAFVSEIPRSGLSKEARDDGLSNTFVTSWQQVPREISAIKMRLGRTTEPTNRFQRTPFQPRHDLHKTEMPHLTKLFPFGIAPELMANDGQQQGKKRRAYAAQPDGTAGTRVTTGQEKKVGHELVALPAHRLNRTLPPELRELAFP